jgi:NAD(P)-dependent dehydrogenase (short-subunit alcohol dehydrogenase family)
VAEQATTVIIGGTRGIGRDLAERIAATGKPVVISGRTVESANETASSIGATVSVDQLVIAAIERDANGVKDYDVVGATRLAVLKLVGYTEVVHTLLDRLTPDAAIVLFGGLAMMRPYPGSTTVTTVNGGISSMVRTLASELAPIRVNALHPGIVGDSPEWSAKNLDLVVSRTPIGRTVTMAEITDATLFLLTNGGVNGVNLMVDGGTLVR